ncbi:hypothetical protein JW898_02405 [Candidatus Woesearchaeota archaeon]|nr:hypothetical protein [Candidatus Woesearchaeota archaeon]
MGRRINRYLSEKEKRERENNDSLLDRQPDRQPGATLQGIAKVLTYTGAALLVAGAIAAELLTAYDTQNPLDRYTPCTYTIQKGDTLTSICRSEGFTGNDLQHCIDQLCRDNRHNQMPDRVTPVFDPLAGECSSMKAGGNIIFVDRNGDGKVNGQECSRDYASEVLRVTQ